MKLKEFQIYKYKSIIDSGPIEVGDLSVLVGKNEAGKTSLLRALHKLNPFQTDPYSIDREWPRGDRPSKSDRQFVCRASFELTPQEKSDLQEFNNQPLPDRVIVKKDYAGRFAVEFPQGLFPDQVHPSEIENACATFPVPMEPVADAFRKIAAEAVAAALKLAREGRFTELSGLGSAQIPELEAAKSPDNPEPQHSNETNYVNAYTAKVTDLGAKLAATQTMQQKAHEYVIGHLPVFIYMDEYRTFQGTAFLEQVKQRVDKKKATPEDETLLMIMALSNLNLDDEVKKAQSSDREQRQYDLDDAGASLTNLIKGRWGQSKYSVQFRGDGTQFFTLVESAPGSGLIRLEERSKGFQWFFSFDLLFMHESKGSFAGCVLLLDEPGLHLHPDAQQDLLRRLEAYAKDNTLIYSTHLPFMLDVRQPERIKVITDLGRGAVVTENLYDTQPEAKLTLQAALGMSGRTSFLLSQRNLVVEGVHDYWLVTELSNLLIRSGKVGLPDDVYVTAAGGAPEAAYVTAIMIGQNLDVVTLLDSDDSGQEAADKLVKRWLTRYKDAKAAIVMLGDAIGISTKVEIEDLFPADYYVEKINTVYGKYLAAAGVTKLELSGGGSLSDKVERAFKAVGLSFNKGSVAKAIRSDLAKMPDVGKLPPPVLVNAEKLMAAINAAFGA
ncbi:MAG: AAA family ATPase [Reyranella sp.]